MRAQGVGGSGLGSMTWVGTLTQASPKPVLPWWLAPQQ